MQITKRNLNDLKLPDRNIRKHCEKQIKEFVRSVEMFGQIRPIVIDEENLVLCGNGLYEALHSTNQKEVDCYVVAGLSPNQKKKLMIADNRIFDLGVNDDEVLNAFLQELNDDLDIPGIDDSWLSSVSFDIDDGIAEASGDPVEPSPEGQQPSMTEHAASAQTPKQTISDCTEINRNEFASENFRHECPRCNFRFND